MRAWVLILAGLIVWAAHFFALYGIASVFPGLPVARWLTLAVTVPALAADGAILVHALRGRSSDDRLDRWIAGLASLGAALSVVAVLWQGLPGLIA